jgi:hypothetical protein
MGGGNPPKPGSSEEKIQRQNKAEADQKAAADRFAKTWKEIDKSWADRKKK